jgi:putative ABC transport system permease protein
MTTALQDLRFALRQFLKAPTFAVVAIVTLALGIGVNCAIFALADATWLRALPFRDADRLAALWEDAPNSPHNVVAPFEFLAWSERSRTFESMATFTPGDRALAGPDGIADSIPAVAVTSRFFDVLGVGAIAGRTFLVSDDQPDANLVVLSEGLWKTKFGGSSAIVGQQIRIDGRPATVVGIAPNDLHGGLPLPGAGRAIGLWTLADTASYRTPGGSQGHFLRVIGRLAAGASLDAARSELRSIAAQIANERPDTNQDRGVTVESLRSAVIGSELRLTSTLLLGVVGLVLLMCSVNVANLQLAKTATRAREIAIRTAIGASRGRIVRQLLTESLLLGAIGGLGGVAVGAVILGAAPSLIPAGLLPAGAALRFTPGVLIFCAVASLVVAVLFGLAPLWQSASMSDAQAIAGDGRATTRSGAALRSAFASAQIAAAVLVLCTAGLLLRTLFALQSVDAGYRATNVLTAEVSLPPPVFGVNSDRYATAAGRLQFYRRVADEVRALPGVRSVAWGSSLPLDGWRYGMFFQIDGDPRLPEGKGQNTRYQIVDEAYFATLGVPLVKGRSFTPEDRADSPPVAIVNEEFVRRYLGGRDPLDTSLVVRAMGTGGGALPVRRIVGVAKQVKERPDETDGEPHIYAPLAQDPWFSHSLVVQAERESTALLPAIRAAVARVDTDVPVARTRTLDDIGDAATSRPRFRALLIGTFGLLALTLAMVGVFGVLAYSVQQRAREFGVRLALGATARDVTKLVLGGAARITVLGAAIGLASSMLFSRWISALLFGVQPLDWLTYLAAGLLLGLTVAAASVLPAVRAARLDPIGVLRQE